MSSRDCALLSTHHVVSDCQPITLFLRLRPSKMFLTADLLLTAEATLGNLCGADCVEGLYPTPHIHEQMTVYIMATSTATLSTMR